MVGRSVSPAPLTEYDVHSYLNAVKEAFHDEPARFEEFVKLLQEAKSSRVEDLSSVVAKVEEFMKDRRDLFLGFSLFLPYEAKITIPPEAKRTVHIKYEHTKKKRVDAENFMNKLKTRFRSLDTHVVGSFQAIMRIFKEGKMSENEMHEKVYDLLYYHEDLIGDFFSFFKKNDPVASASLLLQL